LLSATLRYLWGCFAAALLVLTSTGNADAESCSSPQAPAGCSSASIRARLGDYDVEAAVHGFDQGFKTAVRAVTSYPGDSHSQHTGGPNFHPRSLPVGTVVRPVVCSRDDYAFLPPNALSGFPCDTPSSGTTTDPRQIALGMFDQMNLPSIALGMNPRLGMVAVPTWFWVEGYDGDVVALMDSLVLTHEECHTVADRDAHGQGLLDGDGAPRTRRECQTFSDSMTVEVRVWPKTFVWSFGDNGGRTISCPDVAACRAGVGQPYTDPHSPSPIAHAYQWSSLGANGDADAYTIGLRITFGAQYRFSTNGGSLNGWQGLGERDLSRSASHQVQEAQAVLTRP